MEKTIYIPGDLVMTNGIPIGTKKGIVYQVTESNADKYAKVKDGNSTIHHSPPKSYLLEALASALML
jgi:hypothetical protein